MPGVFEARGGVLMVEFEIQLAGGKYLIKKYIGKKVVGLTTLSSDEMVLLSKSLKEAGF